MSGKPQHPADSGASLRADCTRCFGLCCVAPAFAASSDFAIDKEAGRACPNLQPDSRCGIHDRLRQQGFAGCAVFDCFGAGQHVSQVVFGGQDWRRDSSVAARMFAVFPVVRQLHELLWYLTEALTLAPAGRLHAALRDARAETEGLTRGTPSELAKLHLAAHRERVNALLQEASERARAKAGPRRAEYRGADLVGRSLRGADLRGANLRGAYLIGTDLRDADLTAADVTGADLRGADLSRARLADTLFLTQAQLDSARGNGQTAVPAGRTRPTHWPR